MSHQDKVTFTSGGVTPGGGDDVDDDDSNMQNRNNRNRNFNRSSAGSVLDSSGSNCSASQVCNTKLIQN